jgi:hypothetical protein
MAANRVVKMVVNIGLTVSKNECKHGFKRGC